MFTLIRRALGGAPSQPAPDPRVGELEIRIAGLEEELADMRQKAAEAEGEIARLTAELATAREAAPAPIVRAAAPKRAARKKPAEPKEGA